MDITINITDNSFNLKLAIENEIRSQIAKQVKEKLQTVDFDTVIKQSVEFLITKSKYVSEDVIRNLVQQRIAKQITIDILTP